MSRLCRVMKGFAPSGSLTVLHRLLTGLSVWTATHYKETNMATIGEFFSTLLPLLSDAEVVIHTRLKVPAELTSTLTERRATG
jgi:uncharacterized membrane protein